MYILVYLCKRQSVIVVSFKTIMIWSEIPSPDLFIKNLEHLSQSEEFRCR
jgi:hypothetical protein